MGSVALEGFGSGGAALNFKVVSGTKPASAKENTIWVPADAVNNYYFSATQPENMADYDLWFLTGISSTVEFNVLKKNGIQVYPIAAKQYVGGVLLELDAEIYQNGKWISWIRYLYDKGNEFPEITGGWGKVAGTLTKNSQNFSIDNRGISAQYAAVYTEEKINLDGVKEVVAVAQGTISPGDIAGAHLVVSSARTNIKTNVIAVRDLGADMKDYSLDVETLNGSYYIGFLVAYSGSINHKATVETVLLK